MLQFPQSTQFGRRIPKQKFYEHLDVSAEVKKLFADQVKLIYWQNKLSPEAMNIAAGELVSEIEVFQIKLTGQELSPKVLQIMDKQIPYHLLYILERPDGMMRLWVDYKEAAQSGDNAFLVRQSYSTPWQKPEMLNLSFSALNMDALYESMVRQIAGDALTAPAEGQTLKEMVAQAQEKEKLQRQIDQLKAKMKKEKQLARQMELRREIQRLEGLL